MQAPAVAMGVQRSSRKLCSFSSRRMTRNSWKIDGKRDRLLWMGDLGLHERMRRKIRVKVRVGCRGSSAGRMALATCNEADCQPIVRLGRSCARKPLALRTRRGPVPRQLPGVPIRVAWPGVPRRPWPQNTPCRGGMNALLRFPGAAPRGPRLPVVLPGRRDGVSRPSTRLGRAIALSLAQGGSRCAGFPTGVRWFSGSWPPTGRDRCRRTGRRSARRVSVQVAGGDRAARRAGAWARSWAWCSAGGASPGGGSRLGA